VRRDTDIGVIGETGKLVRGRVAGRASGAGIALLKLDQEIRAVPAEFGTTSALRVGDWVVAVARTRRGNIVASSGIISGLMGEWRAPGTRIDQFIRPDLTLYSGFSGGALIGPEGKILGMATAGLLRGKTMAIPGSTLTRVAEELLASGHMTTPYVGLVMQPISIPESLQKQSGVKAAGGLLVMHSEPGGPADKSGTLIGDILVDLDGHPANDIEDLQDVLRQRGVNQEVKDGLIRGGKKTHLPIKNGGRPLPYCRGT
jgi:S1-C subfamily serine protease